ncbi:MAG: CRISPR-associated protein Csx3 [Pyrobaculum sp.]
MPNNKIEWLDVKKKDNDVYVEIQLTPTQTIEPSDIPQAVDYVFKRVNELNGGKRVRITGRGPVWLYVALVHTVAHLCECVQVFDAVQRRWITVVTHSNICKLGEIEYA